MVNTGEFRFDKNFFSWFKVVGFNIFSDEAKTFKGKVLKYFYFVFVILNLIVVTISQLFFITKNWNQTNEVYKILPTITNNVLLVFKMIMLFKHRKIVVEVSKWVDAKLINIDQDNFKLASHFKKLHRFRIGYTCFLLIGIFLYITFTFLTFLFYGTERFAFPLSLPFSHTDWRPFWCVQLWFLWNFFNCVVMTYSVNLLVFSIIMTVGNSFNVLATEIEGFGKKTSIDDIKKFVIRHEDILSICDKLETIYSSTFLATFIQSSVLLTLVIFQLIYTTDDLSYMIFLPILTVACTEVYANFYLGQNLSDSSMLVSEGAYNCEWYCFENLKLRHDVFLIMKRSEKPIKLTALAFTELSNKNFAKVKKSRKKHLRNILSNHLFTDYFISLFLLHIDETFLQ